MTKTHSPAPCEADVKRLIKKRLELAGWFITDTSQNRRAGTGMRGLPDLICVRRNCAVFIEVKQPGGRIEKSERDWFANIASHCGDNVYHFFADRLESVPGWMREVKAGG